MYRKILVPLDGSLFAEQALAEAVSIARAFNAELHLIHVVTNVINPPYSIEYAVDDTFQETALDEARQYLARTQHRLEAQLMRPVESNVIEGAVAENIVDYAALHHCDLIVMATHGRSGLGRWVFGSTAERVLRAAHCPILLVRVNENEPQPTSAEIGVVSTS